MNYSPVTGIKRSKETSTRRSEYEHTNTPPISPLKQFSDSEVTWGKDSGEGQRDFFGVKSDFYQALAAQKSLVKPTRI
jgi:hypothetical protein